MQQTYLARFLFFMFRFSFPIFIKYCPRPLLFYSFSPMYYQDTVYRISKILGVIFKSTGNVNLIT